LDRNKTKKVLDAAEKTADAAALTAGSVIRLAVRIVLMVVLIFITTGLLLACIFAFYVKNTLSTNLDIKLEDFALSLSSSIWYTDKSGESKELVSLYSTENRVWVDYDNIPKDMEHALVAIEDKRFYKHKGVDWYRTAGAFAGMFLTMRNEFGGSTLTQQLIKNVTQNDEVTVQRKLLEIFQALELEKTYTKEEIVTYYLNVVYFGQGCYGVETAAQTYFGKDVWDLSLAECASIVGITNNPSKYDPFGAAMIEDPETGIAYSNREWNKRRQETILREMYDQGYISYDQYTQAVNEELQFVRSESETYEMEIYTWYEEAVIDDVLQDLMDTKNINIETARHLLYNGGYQIYACIDPEIQAVVDSVYENLDALPQPYYATSQQLQSAIVIMDPYTGEIKAMSGGVGEKTINTGLNRATDAQRPSGSSTKPISVYGPAMEYGLITQNTLVDDAAPGTTVQLKGTSWYPRNSGNTYNGIVTIRVALQKSLNTVAAQIMDKLTPEVAYDFMVNRLGFTSLIEADCDYAPLALGQYTNGVTVREMCQAYGAFVNEGTFTYSRTYTRVTDADGNIILENEPQTIQAFSPNTAANMCDMLQNAVSSGTGSGAYFSGVAVAGKTGTTSNNKDRYFCGFTPYYVAACWTGYDTPEVMYFYNNPAVVIWKTIMQQIHTGLDYKGFPTPVIGQPTDIFGDLEEEQKKREEEEEEQRRQEEEEEELRRRLEELFGNQDNDTDPEPSETPSHTSQPEPSREPDPIYTGDPAAMPGF
jgi:penicillin-binding protein 1A